MRVLENNTLLPLSKLLNIIFGIIAKEKGVHLPSIWMWTMVNECMDQATQLLEINLCYNV